MIMEREEGKKTDKILSLDEYLHKMRPDLLKLVKSDYDNYMRWISPSTFLEFGRTYKPTRKHNGEEWLLDDYDAVIYDGHKSIKHPGIALHFTKTKYDNRWRSINEKIDECWLSPQELYEMCLVDVTTEIQKVKLGTHKYRVQWFWHPDHFKNDDDSWRDIIGLEFHHTSGLHMPYDNMRYDDTPSRHMCELYWTNAWHDEETDEIRSSGWNNLRLAADNTCWCVETGCEHGFYSLSDGRYEGRFTLREAKKRYLGVDSLRELTPIFTKLPAFNDENLRVEL